MTQAASPAPEDLLPLTPATFHILLALVGQERHGYSILREVETATQGALRLGATTLYRSIKHMLAAHLIAECAERPDPELDDERAATIGSRHLANMSCKRRPHASLPW